MLYKTITLGLMEANPASYQLLARYRLALPVMELLARHLKDRHETWKRLLTSAGPTRDPNSMAIEAMQLAVEELEKRLAAWSPRLDWPLSLDQAAAEILEGSPVA